MNIDTSILQLYSSLAPSTPGTGTSLLNAIYGYGGQTAPASSGQSPVQALLTAQRTQTTGVQQTAQQPEVKTAIAAFTKAVTSATSLQQALHNPAVLNVLLTANGLSDQIGSTALAVQVLTSNLSSPSSLANVLTDTRWKTLAQTYNLATTGLKTLQSPKVIAAITQGYAQATWEKNQNAVTPGISDALAFIQQAGSIATVDQVLGNSAVRRVVTTALGVPQQIAFQSLTAQEQAIGTRFNVADLKNPAFVQNFAERFMTMNNLSGPASNAGATDLTSLAASIPAGSFT